MFVPFDPLVMSQYIAPTMVHALARRSRLSMGVAIVVGVNAAASSPMPAQTERHSLSGRELSIFNVAGRVTIERGTGSEVTVELTRGGKDASRLKVASGEIRGRNTLRVLYPDDNDVVYNADREKKLNSSSDLRIDAEGTWDQSGRRGDRSSHRIRRRGYPRALHRRG